MAYSKIQIHFSKSTTKKRILTWAEKARLQKLGDGLDGSYYFEWKDEGFCDYLEGECHSCDEDNLYWQLENFGNFLRSLKDVSRFEFSVWVEGDGISFNREEQNESE